MHQYTATRQVLVFEAIPTISSAELFKGVAPATVIPFFCT